MKFRIKQFASGYVIFELEAKNRGEAEAMLARAITGGDDEFADHFHSNMLKQVDFQADDGGELILCK